METAMSKLSEPIPMFGVKGKPHVVKSLGVYGVEQQSLSMFGYTRRRDAVKAWNRMVKQITHAAYLKATI